MILKKKTDLIKRIIVLSAILISLVSCGENKTCGDNCRKPSAPTTSSEKVIVSDTSKSIACKLTSEELEKRKTDVLAMLKSKILEKKELSNGYSFRFTNSDEMINTLTDFIKSERQCCDFFNFAIHVHNDGNLWFDLTGPKDAKEMIGTELEL